MIRSLGASIGAFERLCGRKYTHTGAEATHPSRWAAPASYSLTYECTDRAVGTGETDEYASMRQGGRSMSRTSRWTEKMKVNPAMHINDLCRERKPTLTCGILEMRTKMTTMMSLAA